MIGNSKNSTFSIIRCGVDKHVYGVDMEWIRSIEQTDRVQWEAGADGLLGHLQTAREQIPIYSLGQRLGQPLTGLSDDQRVIVLESKRPFALLVDRVTPVTQVRPEQLRPLPAAVVDQRNDYFDGLVQIGGHYVPLLAVEQLLPGGKKRPLTAVWPKPTPKPTSNGHKPAFQPQIVVFNVPNMPSDSQIVFALSLSQVPEIRDPIPPMPVPNAPAHIVGLINWRDQAVPVLNLAHYWQPDQPLRVEPESTLRLLIAHTAIKDFHVALFVEPDVRLQRLPLPNQPTPTNGALDPQLLRGSLQVGNEHMLIPDLLKMLELARSV